MCTLFLDASVADACVDSNTNVSLASVDTEVGDDDCMIISASTPSPTNVNVHTDDMKSNLNVYAMLVEVKGPRDRLSWQQRAWIAALSPYIRCETCLVKERRHSTTHAAQCDDD